MNKLAAILLFVSLLSIQSVSAQTTANWDWGYSLYQALDGNVSTSVCTDNSGNFYTTGAYSGLSMVYWPHGVDSASVIYGFGSTTYSSGYYFAYDSAASIIGYQQCSSAYGNATVSKILIDNSNNMYLAGTFAGVTLHPVGSTATLFNYSTSGGSSDVFIEKISSTTGAAEWSASCGGTNNDYVTDFCVDNNQNVYMIGYYESNFLVCGTDTLRNAAESYQQFFIVKYNSAGNLVWAKTATSNNPDLSSKISVDNNGFLYVAANFMDTFSYDGATIFSTTTGSFEDFIAKIDTSGTLIWIKPIKGSGGYGSDVVCTSNNEIYTTGIFSADTVYLDTFKLINTAGIDASQIYMSKLDSAGHVKWAKSFGGANAQQTTGLAIDQYNNGYVTGSFASPNMVCGYDTLHNEYPGTGNSSFVVRFDSSGNIIYGKSINPIGSTGYVNATGIATDKRGDVYITGNVSSDSIICGSKEQVVATAPYVFSCFIAKIDSVPNCTSTVTATSSTTFCAGDSVIINASGHAGSTWQWYQGSTLISGATSSSYAALSTGVYSVNVTNSYGCVSSASVSVSVNPLPVAGTISGFSTVCSGSVLTLTDATLGGAWSSSNTTIATAGSGGIFAGVAAGIDTAKYSITNTCGTAVAKYLFTVNPTPTLTGTVTATICDSALFTYVPGSTVSGTTFAWSRAFVAGISNAAATGSGSVSETLANTTYAPVAVVYVYTLSAGGCTNTGDVTVTFNPLPAPGTISGHPAFVSVYLLACPMPS